MSGIQTLLMAVFSALLVQAGSAQAQSCKPDQAWHHQHSKLEQDIVSTDIKGSRATRIEVCRDEIASGAKLNVVIQYAGERTPSPLVEGKCSSLFAKWAIVRSTGVQAAAGSAAEAKGVYRVCRE
jgi:hypothetical protein